MRALARWTLATWVTLARAPAWAAAPRLTLVDRELWDAGAAAGSAALLPWERKEECVIILTAVYTVRKPLKKGVTSIKCPTSHLTLLARLTMLSSPTTDRLLLETMDRLFGET